MVMLAVEIKTGFRKSEGREGRGAVVRRTTNKKAPPMGGAFYHQVPGTWYPVLLGYDVGRARAFLALLNVVGDGLSLGQRLEATALDGAVMDEDVLAAVGRSDKAEAFLVTEPLDCTCCHFGNLWIELNVCICRQLSGYYGRSATHYGEEVLPKHYRKTLHSQSIPITEQSRKVFLQTNFD
jgi:hypothetical protein